MAQEALISLTGKFSPLRQWVRERGGGEKVGKRDWGRELANNLRHVSCLQLFLDASEVVAGSEDCDPQSFHPW